MNIDSNNDIMFSIIVPVYNSEEFLHKCTDSLINQTLHNIEIICIDDGSTDNSLSILHDYANNDDRITVLTQKHSGPSAARNKGLNIAKGEYIIFVDSDDWLTHDACSILNYELINNPVDILIFKYTNITNNIPDNKTPWEPFIRRYSGMTINPQLHPELFNGNHAIAGKAINRQFLQQENILLQENITIGEDGCFFLDIFLTAKTLRFLDSKPLYLRRADNYNSITHKRKHYLQTHLFRPRYCTQRVLASNLSDDQKQEFLFKIFDKSISVTYLDWTSSNKHDKKLEINELEECIRTINNEAMATIGKPLPSYFQAIKNIEKFKHPIKRRLWNVSHEQDCTLLRLLGLRIKLRKDLHFLENILYLHNKDKKLKALEIFNHPIYFRRRIYEAKNKLKQQKCQQYYKKHLQSLKLIKNHRTIRVGFLCNCTQKWKCQRLYDLLEQDPAFEPVILISKPIATEHRHYYSKPNEYDTNATFVKEHTIQNGTWFESRGMRTEYVFDIDTMTFRHPKNWNVDVIFYQQPWIFEKQFPITLLSKFMLCCYVPYFLARGLPEWDYNKPFHNQLFKYYIPYEHLTQQYSKKMSNKGKNLRTTGHPMLDIIFPSKNSYDGYVIYAPHWSLNQGTCRFSTFSWSGNFMLKFAQQHSDIKWCFKPHPRLYFQLQNQRIMTPQEVDDYFNAWNEIGMTYELGGYDAIFNNSRAIITDCGSFTTEYLLTEQPLIFLCSQEAIDLNDVTSEIFKNYYHAHNLHELEQHLETVVLNHKDPLKPDRIFDIQRFGLNNYNASENILNDLKQTLDINKKK